MNSIKNIFEQAGFFQYGVVDTASVEFLNEVRGMCEVNTCRKYGKTWACPPGLGTLEECRMRIQKYEKMLVFSGKYELEDSFDYEGMVESAKKFRVSCMKLDDMIKPIINGGFMLTNGGCDMCKECTYPDKPCRFPDKVHGSLEGNGMMVSTVAKQANINYINGADTVTYFGALVCNDDDLKKLMNADNV